MKCPVCHNRVDDDSEFCSHCGAKIVREKKCPKCGFANSVEASFCKKCGTKLVENKTQDVVSNKNAPEKASVQKDNKWPRVRSIIAMSLMLSAMVFLLIFVFTPFLSSDFFPDDDFTIIGFISNVFKAGVGDLFQKGRYVEVINSFVMMVLLILFVALSASFIGTSIYKLVKNIKDKTFFDFTKRVASLYVLFFAIYVYFTRFVINSDRLYADYVGGGVLFTLIYIPLVIPFNSYVVECENKAALNNTLVYRYITRAITFVLGVVIIANLGGNIFHVSYGMPESSGSAELGNLDVITFFGRRMEEINGDAQPFVISSVATSSVSFVINIAIIVFMSLLIKKALSGNSSKRPSYAGGMVFSAVATVLSIILLVLNSITKDTMNNLNSVVTYGINIKASIIGAGNVVISLVLSLVILSNSIAFAVLDKKKNA